MGNGEREHLNYVTTLSNWQAQILNNYFIYFVLYLILFHILRFLATTL